MRLELKQVEANGAGAGTPPWVLERGRRTLGRSVDCDWQVPDAGRTVSKLHCTILRDRDGYLLRDESANGTRVDGVAACGYPDCVLGGERLDFGIGLVDQHLDAAGDVLGHAVFPFSLPSFRGGREASEPVTSMITPHLEIPDRPLCGRPE